MNKFAEAFEIFPRTMAENAGVKATELISTLYAAHSNKETNVAFDIEVCIELKMRFFVLFLVVLY